MGGEMPGGDDAAAVTTRLNHQRARARAVQAEITRLQAERDAVASCIERDEAELFRLLKPLAGIDFDLKVDKNDLDNHAFASCTLSTEARAALNEVLGDLPPGCAQHTILFLDPDDPTGRCRLGSVTAYAGRTSIFIQLYELNAWAIRILRDTYGVSMTIDAGRLAYEQRCATLADELASLEKRLEQIRAGCTDAESGRA